MTKPKTSAEKLREELDRVDANRIRPDGTRPEDPREIGRQMARDIFEQYVKPGEPVIQRTQDD